MKKPYSPPRCEVYYVRTMHLLGTLSAEFEVDFEEIQDNGEWV